MHTTLFLCVLPSFVSFCPQGESRTRQASTEQSIREHNGHGGYVASRTQDGGSVTPLLLFFLGAMHRLLVGKASGVGMSTARLGFHGNCFGT